jgi:hypothetical protein
MTHKIRISTRKGANAVYYDMRKEDLDWIMTQLDRLIIECSEKAISKDTLDKNLIEYWTAPQKELGYSPKHATQNSAQSIVGGILKNVKLGRTRDLTDKICDKLEIIFNDLSQGQEKKLFPNIHIGAVVFENAEEELKKPTEFEKLFDTV